MTSAQVTIRHAADADIAAMHRIRLAVRENQLGDPSMVQPDDYRLMINERGRGWVAEVGGQIAGFAVADVERSNIWALFVDPELDGRGIGRRLHDTMLDWLMSNGAEQVWLSTDPGTRAEAFYQAAHWERAGDYKGEARYEMSKERWLSRRGPAS